MLENSVSPAGLSGDGYGEDYLNFKGWDLADFARLKELERAYFAMEMAAFPQFRVTRALDIGFGLGAFLQFGRERGWQMSGTDAIPALVDAARAAGFDAHAADQLGSLSRNRFDLITAFDVLEHIPLTELPSFLGILATMLEPNGQLLCRFPNGDSPFGRPYQNGDPTHCTVLGEARMVYLARRAGLRVVRFAGEARPVNGMTWQKSLSRLVVRGLEVSVEPCIKHVLFPGWRFALFSPNSICVMQPTQRG